MLTKKTMIAYLSSSAVIGITLAVWRIMLMLKYFDPYNNEYSADAKIPLQILGYTICISLVLMASAYFFIRKQSFASFSASESQASVFSSALLGFVFAAVAVLILIYYSGTLFTSGSHPFFKIIRILSFLLLLFSAVYFIANAADSRVPAKTKQILSFFPTLWALSFLVASYINPAYNYTDPNHNLCNISIAALLLFFLFETRTAVTGKSTPARFIFSLIALICTMVYILPIFVLMAFWELSTGLDVLFEAVECGAIFYIFSVMRAMIVAVKPKETANET